MENALRVIEVNGVKMEVDLRTATRVDQLTIGSAVKVLQKSYGDTFNVYPGVIVGFEPFDSLPTIIIAVMKVDYSSSTIEIVNFNTKSEGVEIVPALDALELQIDKAEVCRKFQLEIDKKQQEIDEIENKRKYFLEKFGQYFLPEADVVN
jgi:hypothetical protein